MCQVAECPLLRSGLSSLLARVDINIHIISKKDLLAKCDDCLSAVQIWTNSDPC